MIRETWDRFSKKPGGKWLFSKLFARLVPYSGSVRPFVHDLASGRCRVTMRDRPPLRNHLRSIHAVALMNLGEMASGLALVYGLPDDTRAILVGLSMEYFKKARGTLEAACNFPVPAVQGREEHELVVDIRDAAGDVVARARAKWLIDRLV
jgi:acyl-coenzyme A thioesterase PaaI-like protein